MAKTRKAKEIKVGDIVDIKDSKEECIGEVISLEPLRVAVVHVRQFELGQVKKKFDASDFDWNQLRREAKKLNIPAKGTRDEIESRIKEELKNQGRVDFVQDDATTSITSTKKRTRSLRSPTSRQTIQKNDCVLIGPNNAKGRVSKTNVPGRKPFEVLVCTGNGIQPLRFFRSELTPATNANCPDNCGPLCGANGQGCPDCWPRKV